MAELMVKMMAYDETLAFYDLFRKIVFFHFVFDPGIIQEASRHRESIFVQK